MLLTDAQVSDEGRIVRLADAEAARADRRRISVLCIDAAPNSFLARELAERGGGTATFLTSSPDQEDISTALDRMVLVSTNPDLLTIFDPVSGTGRTVALSMPPTALSISPDGQHAAVGHDGRISYVNLASAS